MTTKETRIVWKSDDGKYYNSETEALIADATYWKQKYINKPTQINEDIHLEQ